MPAVLAHWVVAKDVAWRFVSGKIDGFQLFQGSKNDQFEQISRYVYLGANGPDLPYFYDADVPGKLLGIGAPGKSEYADLFHYNKQGEFILQLVRVAKETADLARKQRTMAYALGHSTHLAADSIVHPYVNMFAGIYHEQTIEDIHRTSELHQDSWLAHHYFKLNYIDDGSWTNYVPKCTQIVGYTQVEKETKDVFSDIVTACRITYGHGPDLEYLKDCYENFYDLVLDVLYDTATGVPKKPSESLVQHERLKPEVQYLDLLRSKAVNTAEKVCSAVIALYNSDFSEEEENKFRSKVKNWNMDTGYWIDVSLEDNKLKIIWRHTW